MYYKFFEIPVARQLMRQAKVIPIAGQKENPAILEAAFAQIAAELRAGELICIFPEGRLTRTGQLEPFQHGILKALADYPVPVIPLALKGLWGSIFSLAPGRRWLRAPWRFRRRMELEIGPAIPAADFSMAKLEGAIRGMLGETIEPSA
jgi:1-acyl-sn-glycerol-3-phosphate acyltransferase